MAQKNATPSKEQQEYIRDAGLTPLEWSVVKDFDHSMIIRNKVSGEFQMIEKRNDRHV